MASIAGARKLGLQQQYKLVVWNTSEHLAKTEDNQQFASEKEYSDLTSGIQQTGMKILSRMEYGIQNQKWCSPKNVL